jgi:hypothetical protein
MYTIRLIFAQWKCSYPGELMPNVVDSWDEYLMEDNHDGFAESLARHEARVGTDYEWVRCLDVQVPFDIIESLADVPILSTLWKQVGQ